MMPPPTTTIVPAVARFQDTLVNVLRLEKNHFYEQNQHLGLTETQRLWSLRFAELVSVLEPDLPAHVSPSSSSETSDSNAQQRSPSSMVKQQSNRSLPPNLDRHQSSSQQSVSMSKKRSNTFEDGYVPFTSHGIALSPLTTNQPIYDTEPWSAYSLPCKLQRTASGRKVVQKVPMIKEYNNPEDFININKSEFSSNSTSSAAIDIPRQLYELSVSTDRVSQCGMGSNLAHSPSMSSTVGLTSASSSMSRDSSFVGGFEMMAIQSQTSDISNLNADGGNPPHAFEQSLALSNDCNGLFQYDQLNVSRHICFDDSPLSSFPIPAAVTPSLSFASVGEDMEMKRSTSTESSVSSQSTRVQKRRLEIVQSERPIAPKLSDEQLAMSRQSSSSTYLMKRIRSADGSSKEVMQIPKNPYNRPAREKITCLKCDGKPGFRGEHELRRHDERAHSTLRKVWVCVDASPDKSKLAKCKACCQRKTYNAYYNAAAHLRRVHFNPKPKEKKTKCKPEDKRGGSGGGDTPSMEFLKDWMEESEARGDIEPNDPLKTDSDSDSAAPTSVRHRSPPAASPQSTQHTFATDGNEFFDMSFYIDSGCNFAPLDLDGSFNDSYVFDPFPDSVL